MIDTPTAFTARSVLRRSVTIFLRGAPVFLTVAAMGAAAAALLGGALEWVFDRGPGIWGERLGGLLAWVSFLAIAGLVHVAVVRGVFDLMRGQSISLSGCLAVARTRLKPAIVLGLITSLGVTLGTIALILPGLYLRARWFCAFPALAVEGLSPDAALTRSHALSRRHIWSVFAAALIIAALERGINALVMGWVLFGGLDLLDVMQIDGLSTWLRSFLTALPILALEGVVAGVAYHDLSVLQDEAPADDASAALLQVFD